MSKTDHMRALREARFTRSSPSASRRVSPAPADAAPSRPSRPVAPVDKPTRPAEPAIAAAVDDRTTAEPVMTEPVVTEPVVLAVPVTVAPAFEVPTLDIPLPAAVPRVRDTPNPDPIARVCDTPQSLSPSPVSEQIIIPAFDLPEPEAEPFRTTPNPETANDSPDAAIVAGPDVATGPDVASTHGIAPGQPIAAYSLDDLAAVVRSITEDSTPRDAAAIVAAVMTELGFKRKGKKITDAITAAAISTGVLADLPAAPDLGIPAIAS